MSVETKKRILIARELFEAPVGSFFEKIGYELCDSFAEGEFDEHTMIINDFLPEVELPRIKSDPALVFDPQVEKNVRATFDQDLLNNSDVHKLLHAQFSREKEYDFIERYSRQFKKVFVLKIQDYLNVGYFIDTMIIEAYKGRFNYDRMRTYLNSLFTYALTEIEKNPDQQYIDVSYSFSEQAFAVQVSFVKKDFSLAEDFSQGSEQFKFMVNNSNFFELNYFSKRERLTLSVLWFKDARLKNFHSSFIGETASRIVEAPTLKILSGLEEKENIVYSARDQGKKLSIARKLAMFIKNYRKNEEAPKAAEKLEVLDVEYYLTFYPRQNALEEVDSEIKNFILKLLKDDTLYDGISEFVKKISESGIDNQTKDIQRILSGKSLNDIEETLLLNGKPEDLAVGFTRVKGHAEEGDDSLQVIPSMTEDLTNDEKWEETKNHLNKKIEEEVNRIKSEGRNVLQEDIVKVVASQLDVSEENVRIVVAEILDEAVGSMIAKGPKLDSLTDSIRATNALIDSANMRKLEEENVFIKAQLEQMKLEVIKLKAEMAQPKDEVSAVPVEVGIDTSKLKTALARTMIALKSKDKMLVKIKLDTELMKKDKDERIKVLEERIHLIKDEHAKSTDYANIEKLSQLEMENKNLVSKLEIALKKINILNENMVIKDKGEIIKKDKELVTLKTSIQMAQVLIERFKNEKLDLENKLQDEKENLRKYRDEFEAKLKEITLPDHSEAEREIQALMAEKRSLEDRSRLQGNEIKKLEQKLKFTISQLESSNKKKNILAGQKSNDAHTKQLEVASQKLTEVNAEMAEKKKELIKAKQENTLLTNRLSVLERKFSASDKKAA